MIDDEVAHRLLELTVLMNLISQLAQMDLYLREPLKRHHGDGVEALLPIVLLEGNLIRSYLRILRELFGLDLSP